MDDNETPNNQWLVAVIERAQQSALPLLLQSFLEKDDDSVDVETLCDAVTLALLSITGEITEDKMRAALRVVAEPYAVTIGMGWETVADAILGTLEWSPPDRSTHILNSWDR